MNVLHLKYAIEIEKTASFTKAAENLFMGQPNLSKAIKELENTVGFEVFTRGAKGVIPTARGSELINHAKTILLQLDELSSLYTVYNKNKLWFTICAPKGRYITDAFVNFALDLDIKNEIDIEFIESEIDDTINSVVSGEHNLGIIRIQKQYEKYIIELLKNKSIVCEELTSAKSVVIISNKNILANKSEILASELQKQIQIMPSDNDISTISELYTKYEENLKTAHRKIHITDKESQLQLLSKKENTYMLATPMPKKTLKRYNLIEKKCETAENLFKDFLIQKENKALKEIDIIFIKAVKKAVKEYSKNIKN